MHIKGRKGGRKRQMTDSKIKSAKKLLASGVRPRDVAGNLGVSVPTLYRWIQSPLSTNVRYGPFSEGTPTGLYDRRSDDISVGEVERIGI